MSLPDVAGAQPAPLTSDNLRRLGPSLIRPMPPVSISSSSDDDKPTRDNQDDEHQEAKILRLRTWIYNAMQTLVGLGAEGLEILEQDELVISGLGQIGPRPHAASDVDINNVAYLEGKLAYLVAKCNPLSQERRRRRRVATREEAMAEDEARVLAETEAIEGNGSGSGIGNMRGGGASGTGPSPNQHEPHINGAYPTVFPVGLHGRDQDDGKSYYYETLRRHLKHFLSDAEAEAVLKEKACCGADSRKKYAHEPGVAVLADTAGMKNRLRGSYLVMQGTYVTGKMKLHRHTPSFQALEKAALRDLPLPFSLYRYTPPSDLFDMWATFRFLPRVHVLYTEYKLAKITKIGEDVLYPKEYLDLVETRQGAMFRLWLSVAPEQVRTTLQAGTPEEQVFVCRLLGAVLLDESSALRAIKALYSSRSTLWSMRAVKTTNHAPTALDISVEGWLDGLVLTDTDKGAAGAMPLYTPMLGDARAAGTPHAPPVKAASSGSDCSLQEITQDEFFRGHGSGLNPLAPEYIPGAGAYQRGGAMDELDELDELDEPEPDEPEMPPAKRTKCLDLHGHSSLQHDQSVHPSAGAVKTEQTTDAPTPMAAVFTSATATPQSSASSAPTLHAAKTEERKELEGKEKKEEKEERVSATGKSVLGKRALQGS